MMCLRHFLIFLILLPFPTASPLFMGIFVVLMFSKLRPCAYCSILMAVTFFSTCSITFLQPPSPLSSAPSNSTIPLNQTSPSFLYSAPLQSRCWCDLNAGRLLWPVLQGYRVIDADRNDRSKERQQVKDAEGAPKKQEFGRRMFPTETEEEEPQPEQEVTDGEDTLQTPAPVGAVDPNDKEGWFQLPWWLQTSRRGSSDSPSTPSHPAQPTPGPTSTSISSRAPSPISTAAVSNLLNRLDFRLNSIGLVVDFGDWGGARSERAVRHEVGEWIEWNKVLESGEGPLQKLWRWSGLVKADATRSGEADSSSQDRTGGADGADDAEGDDVDSAWKISAVVGGTEREL